MNEHDTQSMIRAELSHWGTFFRANVGEGWIGNQVVHISRPGMARVEPGDVVIRKARHFETGLPKGFSDLFGAVPVTITPAMIGQTVAIFSGIEVKTLTGRVKPEQQNFIDFMQSIGARAGVARSAEQAVNIARGTI